MSDAPGICRLCDVANRRGNAQWQAEHYTCVLCGRYWITYEAWYNVASGVDIRYLRMATRQASEFGHELHLNTQNIEELPSRHTSTSITRNLEKLLAFIAHRCPRPSHTVTIQEHDYPVLDALDPVEMEWYCRYAEDLGLIKSAGSAVELTPAGWARLMGDSGIPMPGRAFVAMAFRPELDDAYQNGIRAAIEEDCGFNAVRMKELAHNEKICDRIIVEIRRAQFVVADFTFQRGGVYFEAGFASALGRTVIWTCRDTDFDGLHFDTRQYNHIKWQQPEDLRQQLAERIRGTIPGARLTSASGVSAT